MRIIFLNLTLTFVLCSFAQATETKAYVKLAEDSSGTAIALEVGVAEFVNDFGDKVDLVGVVHIADLSYYQEINKRLKQYEHVLYELIRDKGETFDPKLLKKRSPVADIQNESAAFLDLSFQLSSVDYSSDAFIHADLSPKELDELVRGSGKTYGGIFLTTVTASYKHSLSNFHEQQVMSLKLLLGLFSANRDIILKRTMAKQLATLDNEMEALGNDLYWLIIEERNKAALKVLKNVLDKKNRGPKKIALFYGAGHMKDFEKRLISDFKFKRKGMDWLTAWDLKSKEREKRKKRKKRKKRTR